MLMSLHMQIEEQKHILASEGNENYDSVWNTVEKKQLLIVTTWRSGSTFLGEILSTHPTVFYHYEPLWQKPMDQIRNKEQVSSSVEHLRRLLHCK